jgi:hypothetical protein
MAPEVLTLDLTTLTLGEMSDIETASGTDFMILYARGSASRAMIARYLNISRGSGQRPNWSEVYDHRPLGKSSSTSPSVPDGSPTLSPA